MSQKKGKPKFPIASVDVSFQAYVPTNRYVQELNKEFYDKYAREPLTFEQLKDEFQKLNFTRRRIAWKIGKLIGEKKEAKVSVSRVQLWILSEDHLRGPQKKDVGCGD